MTRRIRGVTLIELAVTITVLSIAVTAIVGTLSSSSVRSADRMIQQQAAAIASSYLEEIMQKPYTIPNGTEASRSLFDDTSDYASLPDPVVRDQQGAAIPELAAYRVTVQLVPGAMTGLPAGTAQLINVTVTHPGSGVSVLLSGYKTRHP
jgi:MSHA pilin protein MshD